MSARVLALAKRRVTFVRVTFDNGARLEVWTYVWSLFVWPLVYLGWRRWKTR